MKEVLDTREQISQFWIWCGKLEEKDSSFKIGTHHAYTMFSIQKIR